MEEITQLHWKKLCQPLRQRNSRMKLEVHLSNGREPKCKESRQERFQEEISEKEIKSCESCRWKGDWICHYCKKLGHLKENCYAWKRKSED